MFLLMGKALGPDSSLKGVDLRLASCTRRTSDAALPLRTKLQRVACTTGLGSEQEGRLSKPRTEEASRTRLAALGRA
jgi:hypothetical protein